VRPPRWPFDAASPPIKSLPTKYPKTIGKFLERVPQLHHRHRRISGDRSLRRSPSVSIGVTAISIDLTAISITVAASDDEEGVVLPRG
jgi:hypothetical protein